MVTGISWYVVTGIAEKRLYSLKMGAANFSAMPVTTYELRMCHIRDGLNLQHCCENLRFLALLIYFINSYNKTNELH
jgi:hypothetical protein